MEFRNKQGIDGERTKEGVSPIAIRKGRIEEVNGIKKRIKEGNRVEMIVQVQKEDRKHACRLTIRVHFEFTNNL